MWCNAMCQLLLTEVIRKTLMKRRDRLAAYPYSTEGTRTTTYVNPSGTATSTFKGGTAGDYRRMQDCVVSNFKVRSAKGEIFNFPCIRNVATFTNMATGYGHTWTGTPPPSYAATQDEFSDFLGWKLGGYPLEAIPTTLADRLVIPDLSDLYIRVNTSALANVKKPDAEGLVFFGELNQTLDMIRRPLEGVGRLYDSTIARNASSFGNAASSEYLKFMFGIRPIMNDIKGTLEALVKKVSERQTARAQESLEMESGHVTRILHQGSALLYCTYTESAKVRVSVRAGTLYDNRGQSFTDLTGLSIRNIPASAWELIPWSFVIDWFANVGKVISALVASFDTRHLAQWNTTTYEWTYMRWVNPSSFQLATNWSVTRPCSDTQTVRWKCYSRSPVQLSDYIGLRFEGTLRKVPVLTSLALLLQKLTRR